MFQKAIRQAAGIPLLFARRLVADPIFWLDEQLGAGKPAGRPIEITVDVLAYINTSANNDAVERETIKAAVDIGRKAWLQLMLHGRAQIIVILDVPPSERDRDDIKGMTLGKELVTAGISAEYNSSAGLETQVNTLGDFSTVSKTPPRVMIDIAAPHHPAHKTKSVFGI